MTPVFTGREHGQCVRAFSDGRVNTFKNQCSRQFSRSDVNAERVDALTAAASDHARWRTLRCVCRQSLRVRRSSPWRRANPSKDFRIARSCETPHRGRTVVVVVPWRWRSRPCVSTVSCAGRRRASAADRRRHLLRETHLSSRSASATDTPTPVRQYVD